MYSNLESYIQNISIENILESRKIILQMLIDYTREKVSNKEEIRLNFICTHNSRRSHLSQIWAQTMAYYFGVEKVNCYSAGTEVTAIFPMVIETLIQSGFYAEKIAQTNNPIWAIKYSSNETAIIAFSKTIHSHFNPQNEFCAIMTCDSANEACPVISGAELIIPILYKDPKKFDNTPQQAEKYEERSHEIATEMYYVFSQIQVIK